MVKISNLTDNKKFNNKNEAFLRILSNKGIENKINLKKKIKNKFFRAVRKLYFSRKKWKLLKKLFLSIYYRKTLWFWGGIKICYRKITEIYIKNFFLKYNNLKKRKIKNILKQMKYFRENFRLINESSSLRGLDFYYNKKKYFQVINFKLKIFKYLKIFNKKILNQTNKYKKKINKFSSSCNIFHIKFASNNIFFHFTTSRGKTLLIPMCCSVFEEFKISKRNKLKFFAKMLAMYLVEIKKLMEKAKKKGFEEAFLNMIVLKILVGKRHRLRVLRQLKRQVFKVLPNNIINIIDIPLKKSFNGCRGKKLRRKKNFFLRRVCKKIIKS